MSTCGPLLMLPAQRCMPCSSRAHIICAVPCRRCGEDPEISLPRHVLPFSQGETTSSSRIFIKILFQELAENMGLVKLNERLHDKCVQEGRRVRRKLMSLDIAPPSVWLDIAGSGAVPARGRNTASSSMVHTGGLVVLRVSGVMSVVSRAFVGRRGLWDSVWGLGGEWNVCPIAQDCPLLRSWSSLLCRC